MNTRLNKNCDLALAIAPKSNTDQELLKRALNRHGSVSQMLDAYTCRIPLTCGIAVKEFGGDGNEAIAQLAIWSAAGLFHVQQMLAIETQTFDAAALLPLPGWTVVGHQWDLYLIFLRSNSDVVCLGPVFSASTGTLLGLFQILKVLAGLQKWVENVYWPWLRQGLFGALSSSNLGVDLVAAHGDIEVQAGSEVKLS